MEYDMNLKMPWKDICVPVFIKTHVYFVAYQSNFINSPLTLTLSSHFLFQLLTKTDETIH